MIELAKGDELALTDDEGRPLTTLTVGLGWDKERTAGFIGTGAPDIDLDASAVEYTGDQYFDFAFYNNLQTRDGAVVHLGDNLTGRGDGDDEVVTVDLPASTRGSTRSSSWSPATRDTASSGPTAPTAGWSTTRASSALASP